MAKIFLYDDDKKKIITMDRDDPRIAWEQQRDDGSAVAVFRFREHGPLDRPRYSYGDEPARNKWNYRYWGDTREQLCERVNAPICRTVAALEQKIIDLRGQIELTESRKLKP